MRSRRLLTTLLCLAALGPAASSAHAADCPGADLPAGTASAQQMSDAMLCLLNQQRAAAGIPALSADGKLATMATDYAGQIATQHFFSHTSPSGQTLEDRFAAAHYRFDAAGENLAWAGGSGATATEIVGAWMNSAGHRENILDPDFHRIGVAFAISPAGDPAAGTAFVTDFGTPIARAHTRARHHHTARTRLRLRRARARAASLRHH